VGVSAFSVIRDRNAVIDYTTSFYGEWSVILTPAPTEGSKLQSCIQPFSFMVVSYVVERFDPTVYLI